MIAIWSGTMRTFDVTDGLRQGRSSGGATTSYVWDVAAKVPVVLEETTGSSTTTYVYGRNMVSSTVGATTTYYLRDGLGNTVALCNSSGIVTATYAYDAFGAVRIKTGSASTEFTFTGEQNDPNGLEYPSSSSGRALRARYYDNATGRFLSQDPAGQGYPYAGGNPVNRVDPTGLYTICSADLTVCFDSTQVGLPPDPPTYCDVAANLCYWRTSASLEIAPYENTASGPITSFAGAEAFNGAAQYIPGLRNLLNNDLLVSISIYGEFKGDSLNKLLIAWQTDNGWQLDASSIQIATSPGSISITIHAHAVGDPLFAGSSITLPFMAVTTPSAQVCGVGFLTSDLYAKRLGIPVAAIGGVSVRETIMASCHVIP